MKHIEFKLGPIRVEVSYGKPDVAHIHDVGHSLRVEHLPAISWLDGTIPYSTLKATPKL